MTRKGFRTGSRQIDGRKYEEFERTANDKGLSISQAIEIAIDLFIEHNRTKQKEEIPKQEETKHE